MLAVLALAMMLTLLLLPPLMSLGRSARLVATPDARRLHEGAIPQIGGLAIFLGFFLALVLFSGALLPLLWPYLAAAGLLLVVGLYDDYFEVSPWIKLAAQVVAAAAVLLLMPLGAPFSVTLGISGVIAIGVGLLFLVGVTNAVNLSDGLDGLAAGLALLSATSLCALAYWSQTLLCVALLIPMVGGLFGFLRFNTHPARVFMGDHGAYFIGFTLGCCALLLTPQTTGVFSALLLLGIPIYDTLSVALRRIKDGQHPLLPDRRHLHHRLLALGLSHDHTVLCIYVMHALFIVLGFATLQAHPMLVGLLLVLAYSAIELVLARGQRAQLALRHLVSIKRWFANSNLQVSVLSQWLILLGPFAALLMTPAPPADFAIIAGLFLGVLVTFRIYQAPETGWSWVERLLLYVAGSFAVYLLAVDANESLDTAENLYFAMLGGLLVIRLLSAQDNFRLTALDGLVLLGTLSLTAFGQWQLEAYGLQILKLVIWFYAIEVFVLTERRIAWADAALASAYLVIVLRYWIA